MPSHAHVLYAHPLLRYKNYETIIAELREKLAQRSSELERCHDDKDKLFGSSYVRGRLCLQWHDYHLGLVIKIAHRLL